MLNLRQTLSLFKLQPVQVFMVRVHLFKAHSLELWLKCDRCSILTRLHSCMCQAFEDPLYEGSLVNVVLSVANIKAIIDSWEGHFQLICVVKVECLKWALGLVNKEDLQRDSKHDTKNHYFHLKVRGSLRKNHFVVLIETWDLGANHLKQLTELLYRIVSNYLKGAYIWESGYVLNIGSLYYISNVFARTEGEIVSKDSERGQPVLDHLLYVDLFLVKLGWN